MTGRSAWQAPGFRRARRHTLRSEIRESLELACVRPRMSPAAWPTIRSVADLEARATIRVGPSEVVYVFVALDGETSASDEALLDGDELRRARRFVHPAHSRRFIVAHAALRVLLARCLEVEAASIRYESGVHGKPRLRSGLQPLEFNISHSEGLGLLAVTRDRSVGVDVERLRELRDAREIAVAHFSAAERAELESLPVAEQQAAFFTCWTRKEAVIKVSGEGLSRALDSFDVDLRPGSLSALRRFDGRPGREAGISLRAVPAPPGYLASGAVVTSDDALPEWRELSDDSDLEMV